MTVGKDADARRLRRAIPADAAAIARIHAEARRAGYRGLVDDSVLDGLHVDLGRREEEWRERIGADRALLLVSEDPAGRVRGFVGTALPGFDETVTAGMANIAALYTDPGAWGGGHGAALLDATLAHLRDRGDIRRVTLWAIEGNERAIRFYERRGFRLDGEAFSDGERGPRELQMVLDL